MHSDANGGGTKLTAGQRVDELVNEAVFAASEKARDNARRSIWKTALDQGAVPASIQSLYEAAGQGLYEGVTVPAINIRGVTYDVARAVFRAAQRDSVGAFVFEIARSEIGYTAQRPAEYTACLLAAAVREGFRGPVFIQGDHFQANRAGYYADTDKEVGALKELIAEAVEADFLNIDIDASTLVDLDKPTLEEQQENNSRVTAELTEFIRGIEPAGATISVGGEIGEIGKGNSTPEDLRAFMSGYRRLLPPGVTGISKVSVQTGTTHGGVVLPDGSIASVSVDFETLEQLSRLAREEWGMGGAVQHGASTLPDDAFGVFPRTGVLEVHLATGFQNIILDGPFFPRELTDEIHRGLNEKYHEERTPGQTDQQFIYKTRKKAFGNFKRQMWALPEDNRAAMRQALEERFSLLFRELKVVGTTELVGRYVSGG
ncbi:MAG: class II fructose-bisphosphate aldolase [Dehalococcoidales bacterium]